MITWLRSFLRLIFPETCITCSTSLVKPEKWVCLNCLTDLSFLYEYQHPQNNKTYYQIAGLVPIQGAFAGFQYDKGKKIQTLIHHLKYYQKPELGVILGQYLAKQIGACPFPLDSVIVPIPLHPRKLKKRGYNQAAMIAKGIASAWHLNLQQDALTRIKFTSTQTRKTKEERQKNVENAFQLIQPIHHPVILVDDVITTGSTIVSACKTLKTSGVEKIYVITLATADS